MAERAGFEPATPYKSVLHFPSVVFVRPVTFLKIRGLGFAPSWSDSQSEALLHRLPSGKIGAPAEA